MEKDEKATVDKKTANKKTANKKNVDKKNANKKNAGQKKMSRTKELYLTEALKLFADKGYEAVGVVEIARAVGCTPSALYKHFSGKKELFDAILEMGARAFEENMSDLKVNFAEFTEEEKGKILYMSEEEQIELLKRMFFSIAEGEYPRLFRKLMTVEQFKHPELGRLYSERYIEKQCQSFDCLMKIWVEGGIMRPMDTHMMAVQYVSPIVLLISVYDREPEKKEELLREMENHVRQFNRIYRLEEKAVI